MIHISTCCGLLNYFHFIAIVYMSGEVEFLFYITSNNKGYRVCLGVLLKIVKNFFVVRKSAGKKSDVVEIR